MNSQLIAKAKSLESVKYVFFDYYDTVIHRKVHPLKPFKIWAKILKTKLKLSISITEIYEIRRGAMKSLSKKLGRVESELSYHVVIKEIYERLLEKKELSLETSFENFLKYSSEADFESESSVQYLNKKTVADLKMLKELGYKIYCVSDFHSDEELISQLLRYHEIEHLYDKIFVSASQNASKENKGFLFQHIKEKEELQFNEILMVGDNPVSDIANAKLHGMETHYLKRYGHKLKQKYQFLVLTLNHFF
ncbi:HAD-IA family hydrolase [Maribacter sp. 2210JD10-5]|uniref:HAD-IA family hydrolase n=1 Tax=Maribacter sp. 2210JD10-5 TaxID=3386272 RepID=UPI0039BCFCCC